MSLSDSQLLLLDCFMYSDLAPNNRGRTLESIISDYIDPKTGEISVDLINNGGIRLSGDLPDHPEYLADIMTEIYNDPELRSLKITHVTEEYEGSIRGACFVDSEGNATVAFRGTGGSYRQWNNNFEGYGDLSQQSQRDAAAFINSLPYDNIDVTGHSNGADEAMYVTIVCGDKIRRCVCYEGQGVSKEFLMEYADAIRQNKDKITNICADNDFVSPLLFNIAGKTIYVKSNNALVHGLFSHGSYGLWITNKEYLETHNGNFPEETGIEQVWYCKAIQVMTVFLSELSDVPIVGSCLELLTDLLGVVVGGVISKDWDEALFDVIKSLKEFATNLAKDAMTIIDAGIRALQYIDNVVKSWFSRVFSGSGAVYSPFITVDTYKLRNYAQRLQAVNRRINNLDRRLDSLYWKVGLLDLWRLMQADLLTGYSWRLLRCSGYLYDTATDFDNVESDLQNQL